MDHDEVIENERRLMSIENRLASMETTMKTMQGNVSTLVEAWNAASWLVSVIKWGGGLAIAITAIVTLLKGKV